MLSAAPGAGALINAARYRAAMSVPPDATTAPASRTGADARLADAVTETVLRAAECVLSFPLSETASEARRNNMAVTVNLRSDDRSVTLQLRELPRPLDRP